MMVAYYTGDLKKKLQAKVDQLYATWQKDYALESTKPTPKPEAAQYLCRVKDKTKVKTGLSVDNLMIGVVKDKNCVYASSFAAWAMKGPDTVSGVPVAANKYEVLMAGKGVKWVNSLGTIPQRALALGYKSSSFHISGRKIGQKTALASIYACRTTTHEEVCRPSAGPPTAMNARTSIKAR